MTKYQEYLEKLKLSEGASLEDIKSARRELIKIWHPDKYVNNENLQRRATKKTQEINEAYEYLIKNYKNEYEENIDETEEETDIEFPQNEVFKQNYYTDFKIEDDNTFDYTQSRFKRFKTNSSLKAFIAFVPTILLITFFANTQKIILHKKIHHREKTVSEQHMSRINKQQENETVEAPPQFENPALSDEASIVQVQKPVTPKVDESEMNSYKTDLRSFLFSTMNFASVHGNGSCIVGFSVDGSGNLINPNFIQKSQNQSLNAMVFNAVINTPYFNAPPKNYNGEILKLSVKFYNGEYEIDLG